MQNEKPIVAVEFNLNVLGKEGKVSSKLNVVRVRRGTIKEPVQPKGKHYDIKDIFDDIVLNTKYNIRTRCKYGANWRTNIYVTTDTREFLIGSIYSSYGRNKFPVSPNKKDIESLKVMIRMIKDKVKELKDWFEYSYEDKFYLG